MHCSHRYGGYIAQSTGDDIFAVFGAPVALEDHPQRAYLQKLLRVRVVKPMKNRKVVYQSTISARAGTEYLPRQVPTKVGLIVIIHFGTGPFAQ